MAEKKAVVGTAGNEAAEVAKSAYTPWKVTRVIWNGKEKPADDSLADIFCNEEGAVSAKNAALLYAPQAETIKNDLQGAITVTKKQTGEVRTYAFTGKQLKMRIVAIQAIHDSKIKFHVDVPPKPKAEGNRRTGTGKVVVNFADA